MEQETIYYQYNKWYVCVVFIGSFFVICTPIPILIEQFNSHPKTIFLILLFLSGLLWFYIYSQFKNHIIPVIRGKIVLEVNNNGIISKWDNLNIKWDNIRDFRLSYQHIYRVILVDVIDEKSLISNEKNLMKKYILWMNNLFYSTPVVISLTGIKGHNQEIFALLKNSLPQN